MKSDVAVVGGGPAGATAGMVLARSGLSETVVESDPFPRFQIGESMTGALGVAVRALGLKAEMDALGAPVKLGVSVYGTSKRGSFAGRVWADEPSPGLRTIRDMQSATPGGPDAAA